MLGVAGSTAGGKEAVGHHQNRDEPQKKNGIGGMVLPVLCGHGVPGRLENQPADRGDDHAEEDDGRGVVGDDVVDVGRSFPKDQA